MVEDHRPTWWQRKRRPWCTHVLYLDEQAYKMFVQLLRILNKLRLRNEH